MISQLVMLKMKKKFSDNGIMTEISNKRDTFEAKLSHSSCRYLFSRQSLKEQTNF